MIRHNAFFETLGTLEERTPEWHAVFAGLSILRMVDRLSLEADLAQASTWSELRNTRESIESVNPGNPVRAILGRTMGSIESQKYLSERIGAELLSYGRALDLEGRWALAADVFRTIADVFPPDQRPRLVIEAATALGAAARNVGDWE